MVGKNSIGHFLGQDNCDIACCKQNIYLKLLKLGLQGAMGRVLCFQFILQSADSSLLLLDNTLQQTQV